MNVKSHHILIFLVSILVIGAITIPILDKGLSTFQRTEQDITKEVRSSILELEASSDPIKYTISDSTITETYYRNSSEQTQIKLTEKDSTKIYSVQTQEDITVTEYTYSSPVGIREYSHRLSQADQSKLIDYYTPLSSLDPILSNYETETALRVNSYTKNGTTTEKYVVSHVNNSETIDITLTNDRVTNIDMGNMTVTITYNAEKPDRPEDPEPEIPDRTETSTPQN